jgi:hypothetical protein
MIPGEFRGEGCRRVPVGSGKAFGRLAAFTSIGIQGTEAGRVMQDGFRPQEKTPKKLLLD